MPPIGGLQDESLSRWQFQSVPEAPPAASQRQTPRYHVFLPSGEATSLPQHQHRRSSPYLSGGASLDGFQADSPEGSLCTGHFPPGKGASSMDASQALNTKNPPSSPHCHTQRPTSAWPQSPPPLRHGGPLLLPPRPQRNPPLPILRPPRPLHRHHRHPPPPPALPPPLRPPLPRHLLRLGLAPGLLPHHRPLLNALAFFRAMLTSRDAFPPPTTWWMDCVCIN